MKTEIVLTTVALCVILFVQSCSALECYVCNSKDVPECENPPLSLLKNCSESSRGSRFGACRKIDQNLDFEVGDLKAHKRTIRQCAVEGEMDRPCYYKAGFGGRVNVCHCFESRCNGAQTLTGVAALLSSAIFFASVKFLLGSH